MDFLDVAQDHTARKRVLFGVGHIGGEVRGMAEMGSVFKHKRELEGLVGLFEELEELGEKGFG